MSQFTKFLGESPYIKVLDMLITGRGLDYSISDIASTAGIGRVTFYRMLDKLLREKIIVKSRKIGNMQLYILNEKNNKVLALIELYDKILCEASKDSLKVKLK